MQKLFNQQQEQQIITEYRTGLSTIKLGKKYNCSPGAINNVLKRNGITATSNKVYRRKYELNQNFFENIDSEEKAYWLGFLYADGNVRISKSGQHLIQLKVYDKEVIEKFLKSLNCNMPIGEYTNWTGHKYFGAHLTSEKMFSDLCKHGCVPNKSLILKFPELSKEMAKHFIRGYFDGDGSVFINCKKWIKTPKTNPMEQYYYKLGVSFNGTQEMLSKINEYFYIGPVTKEKRRKTNCWYISTSDQKKCKDFYNYIYQDSKLYLTRKKEKFDNFLKKDVQRL